MRETKEFLKFIENSKENKLYLVKVLETQGSTYRKAGARKIISQNGQSIGLISGGCLESEIVERCLDSQVTPLQFEIDTDFDQDRFFGSTLGCLGKLLLECRIYQSSELTDMFEKELTSEEALTVHIVGAGPDTHPLKELLDWTGWHYQFYTTLREQMEELNGKGWNVKRFELGSFRVDINSKTKNAVILMSHNYPTDLEILKSLVSSPPDFVGLLGPVNRQQSLIQDLQSIYSLVPSSEFLKKLHSPVGLDYMGRGEYAVALSIVAELQSFFYGH